MNKMRLSVNLAHKISRKSLSAFPSITAQAATETNSVSASINENLTRLANEGKLKEAVAILYDIRHQGASISIYSYTYSSLLQTCASMKALSEGKIIHSHILMNAGSASNISLLNKVVTTYCKCGSLVDARQVFDEMPERNSGSWNAIISGYARQGNCEEALLLFRRMQTEGIEPHPFIMTSILSVCGRLSAMQNGKEIHSYVVRSGFEEEDVFVGSCLVDMYAKCGNVEDARNVFDKMHQRNVVSWNTMIAGYVQIEDLDEASKLFDEMEIIGLKRNAVTWNSIIAGYARNGQGAEVLELFGQMKLAGICPDSVTWNAMITGCAQSGKGNEALELFRQMQLAGLNPNVVSWNSLITGCVQNGCNVNALELLHQMQLTGIKPNSITIVSSLTACARLEDFLHGKEIHDRVVRCGYLSDVFVGNALIDMYIKCRKIKDAQRHFDKMARKDVISWTSMIASYAQDGDYDLVLKFFYQMQLEGTKPNSITWNAMISGYAQNGHNDKALELFKQMQQEGIKPDVTSWNVLIGGYAQNGNGSLALDMLQQMQMVGIMPNVITWNAIIAGNVNNGNAEAALKVYSQMQMQGVKHDPVTLLSVLLACTRLSALQKGKEIHSTIIRKKHDLDVSVGNALIDMYAKCGSIQNGVQVFEKMSDKDVVSWNAMIVGYGMHGHGEDALKVFGQMQQSGTKPNYITFIGVLSACVHAGMVDEGRSYFACMIQNYFITPCVEHYACMVDLLGRAGCLEEAYDFIKSMPLKPTASMLGALLGACNIYNNAELAETVANQLFQIEPQNAGNYVLLSNIYAAAGRWDDARKVRKIMQNRGLKKKPGCSWIDI
ncbi:pentatricopeptide repeat-containing protein At4g02750 [Cryptomeria japonica]|uniref:pentatricopeptide repeat-containing protein At4g02750 n=1 Tax=Cryptomeria japonica TaxID=3369 RepID=UPI0027DA1EF0|nr:pentatricopeptide repeat-containing protein At4g02750 [Cryptomeria japonica]XP_057848840.2 pentatricopeptide repeat-containing protein At4g02750 [Cryptomeria japonica]